MVKGIQPGSPKTTTKHTLTNLLIMLIAFIILYNVNQVGKFDGIVYLNPVNIEDTKQDEKTNWENHIDPKK